LIEVVSFIDQSACCSVITYFTT